MMLKPTESELEIMQLLWEKGPLTVRKVNDLLNEQRRVGYTTTLKIMQIMAEKGLLSVEVDPKPGINYTIRFVGSPKDVSLDHAVPDPVVDGKGASHPVTGTYADERLGAVMKEVEGTKALYKLTGSELYVRAVVSCDAEELPVIDSGAIPRMAWTQPVGWEKYIKNAE